jgi:hypothetical protein
MNPERFTKAEIDTGISAVLLKILDHVWDAARLSGHPLPCLEGELPLDEMDDEP